MKKTLQQYNVKSTTNGLTIRLDYYRLQLLGQSLDRCYTRIQRDGIQHLREREGLTKSPSEIILIELCYNAQRKVNKKVAERLNFNTITLPLAESCALWELYKYGYLYYNVDDNAITTLFTEIHPLLNS